MTRNRLYPRPIGLASFALLQVYSYLHLSQQRHPFHSTHFFSSSMGNCVPFVQCQGIPSIAWLNVVQIYKCVLVEYTPTVYVMNKHKTDFRTFWQSTMNCIFILIVCIFIFIAFYMLFLFLYKVYHVRI